MSKVSIDFDKYLLHDELTSYLKEYAKNYPTFVNLESIGKSYEERDVWAVTITNKDTGRPQDKPAMYVDGNIHAGEVTGSMACLHLIDYLLNNYETKAEVKKLLDQKTFYILPRVNPDGAEKYLTTPTMLRSSVRIVPTWRKDEDPPGLHAEDIDNDGNILLMRIRDDKRGSWAIDPKDPRLMVERSPLDLDGPFYHILTEGVLKDEHGELVEQVEEPFEIVPVPYGLDLNRNFPAGYSPLTKGSGPFPLSEPETRNQIEFISNHKNIAGVLLYHTTGGVLFRPHSTIPDKDFAKEDVALYEFFGDLGKQATGYPTVCCYGDIWSGVLDDWCFEQLGLFAFTPELWDAVGRAAPEMKKNPVKQLSATERRDLELKLLQWNDKELAGKGFVDWHEVDHQQFGKIEIGGWLVKECRQNPPTKFLEQECYKITQFSVNYALSLPEAHIDEIHVDRLGDNIYSIQAVVSNHGYLSTNISKQALKQKAVREDLIRLELPTQAELISSQWQHGLGFMEGYSVGQKNRFYHYASPAKSVRRVKWTVKVPADTEPVEGKVVLTSERGGKKERTISLA